VKFDSNPCNSKKVMTETRNTAIWALTFKCDLDLGPRELDATHLLMVLYNSVKFDSNPFINTEVMAETRNVTDERTDRQTNEWTNERTNGQTVQSLYASSFRRGHKNKQHRWDPWQCNGPDFTKDQVKIWLNPNTSNSVS